MCVELCAYQFNGFVKPYVYCNTHVYVWSFVNWIATKFNLILPQIDARGCKRKYLYILDYFIIFRFDLIILYCLKPLAVEGEPGGEEKCTYVERRRLLCVFRPITVSITDEWIRPNGRAPHYCVNVISKASRIRRKRNWLRAYTLEGNR